MIDIDTFLTTLYVMADDFCKEQYPDTETVGRPASLTVSEVLTLSVFSQWYKFRSQRDFYGWAQSHLKPAFPHLPDRGEYNRLVRKQRQVAEDFFLYLVQALVARQSPYEVLDTSGVPVRNVKRRGLGWLSGLAKVGWCTREGWYFGFRLLTSVNAEGAITGFAFAEGSAKDQPMSDCFIALRHQATPLLKSVGKPALGPYLLDKGFAGRERFANWLAQYGVHALCEPQSHAVPWPKPMRQWLHRLRQIVETTFAKLIDFFRLDRNRPHDLTGFQADLTAKVILYNFCMWLNKQLNRPPLAFSDLLDW